MFLFLEGYVKVNDILNDQRFQSACGALTFDDIRHIVDKNDKKRFEMRKQGEEWHIKAVQGHTIQVQKCMSNNIIILMANLTMDIYILQLCRWTARHWRLDNSTPDFFMAESDCSDFLELIF